MDSVGSNICVRCDHHRFEHRQPDPDDPDDTSTNCEMTYCICLMFTEEKR